MEIKEVVEKYGIELKKMGRLYLGYCPFHDDKNTPNFYVYPHTNSWWCYKENIGGDVISFIAKMEHVDRDAVKKTLAFDILRQRSDVLKPRSESNLDFKPKLLYLASKCCYAYLRKHPHKLEPAMQILKKFDEVVNSSETLTYRRSTELVEKLKKYLYNI